MMTKEELQKIINIVNEQNQEASAQQANKNPTQMQTIFENQTKSTRQMLDAFIKRLQSTREKSDRNEGKKVIWQSLIRPETFSAPTHNISLNHFVKVYCNFVDQICERGEGAYARYLRSFLDGPAAIWYDAYVGDNITESFNAVTAAMQTHFEHESHNQAYSYLPTQDNRPVIEFYNDLLKIVTAQCWSVEKQLNLFQTGTADQYKLSLDAHCPKALTEAYNMALVIEANKTQKFNMNKSEKNMINMLIETDTKLNAPKDKIIDETKNNKVKNETQETVRTLKYGANICMLANAIMKISEMILNVQNHQPMPVDHENYFMY